MSEIRQLLAAAQEAEVQGDRSAATRMLREAARWYQDRNLGPRAEQMLRHADRLGGEADPGLPGPHLGGPGVTGPGVGDPGVTGPGDPGPGDRGESDGGPVWDLGVDENPSSNQTLVEQRRPLPAPAGSPAWCSFCCRPGEETGPLIAGPQGAGAFICAECIAVSAALLGGRPAPRPEPTATPSGPVPLLRQQTLVAERFRARRPKLAVLLGPPATGKTTLLRHLGGPHLEPWGDRPLLALDLPGPLPLDEERRLLRWLDASPERQLVLAMRAEAPDPALVLRGPDGPEPIFDTSALRAKAELGSEELMTRIELVLMLTIPSAEELVSLGKARLEARGITLPPASFRDLLAIALRSTRPLSELLALINRIPPGTYEAP